MSRRAPLMPPEIAQALQSEQARRDLERQITQQLASRLLEGYEPYPKQRAFHQAGAQYRERALIAGNQLGKALRSDTPVLTPTGWCPIGALEPGDRVIGGSGASCRVLAVYPQGVVPLHRLRFDYGQTIDACGDHLWRVMTPRVRWNPAKAAAKTAWTVERTADMRARYGDSPVPKNRHAVPHCGIVEFDPQPVPVDPYLLGVLLGDGCTSHAAVSYSTRDAEMVEMVDAVVAPMGLRSVYRSGADYSITAGRQMGGRANLLKAALSGLGIMGKGAHDKAVPPAYLWNSSDIRLAVLQGLMDTDGTCEKSGITTFTSVSPQLADDVAFLARSFGAKCHIRSRVTSYTHNGEKREGRPSFTVTIRLPHIPMFRLDRKQARYIRPVSTTDNHVVEAFEDAPEGDATCITVDSPDSTFVTEGFIVTHNTFSAGAETAYHLTGDYPPWWQGRRFDRPTAGWACGVTSEVTRDTVQRTLLGRAEQLGTGAIPRRSIKSTSASRGISNSIDTAFIHHQSGGVSQVQFKSYEAGREKFQGESLDWIWCDEEPPADIYSECLTRTNATGGVVYCTFTPLLGMTQVVLMFYPRPSSPDRFAVQMEIEDALHISPEQRARVIASYRPHEREARTRGVPMLGSGAVITVPESAWITEAFAIPPHWPGIIGLDIGTDHPAGAALLRFDLDADTAYVTNSIASPDLTIGQHANIVKSFGRYPVAWPHDAGQRDKQSGAPIAAIYRNHGLDCLLEHATHPDGGYGLEASIADIVTRMEEGRLKIFSHLHSLRQELRMWHRDEGKVVALNDDEISAMRYGMMMRRFARRARAMDGQEATMRRRIGLP